MRKVTVKLLGQFAELAGASEFRVFASCAREAIQMLTQFPKLDPKTTSKRYVATIDEVPMADALDAPLTVETLTLIPQQQSAYRGAGGDGGVLRIVVGAVLVVVGIVVTPWSGPVGSGLIAAGIGLMLGGLYMLLFPPEGPEDASGGSNSHSFSNKNTTQSGTPIPILLGEIKHAGHILSYNLDPTKRGSSASASGDTPQGWRKIK